MITKVQSETPNLGYIVGANYLSAFSEAEELVNKNPGFHIVSFPQLIQALTNPTIRKAVCLLGIDTTSAEFHCQDKNGDRNYIVAHGLGPFSSAAAIGNHFPQPKQKGFSSISREAKKSLFESSVSMADVRKGNVPKDIPYAVRHNIDKDGYTLTMGGVKGNYLSRDDFLKDDRVLAICGSPELREMLGNILFTPFEQGGEGMEYFSCQHDIFTADYHKTAFGYPLSFGHNHSGIDRMMYNRRGRFLVLPPETQPKILTLNDVVAEAGRESYFDPAQLQHMDNLLKNGGYSIIKGQ